MAEINARWEWRTFAKQIGLDLDLRSFERTRHTESSETYLVAETSWVNCKIRDGKLDIKALQSVDDQGLEQWKPTMEVSFPFSKEQVIQVFQALDLVSPDLQADCYDVDGFLALAAQDGRVLVVQVDKIRDQYDVNGCTVEMANVSFDGDRYQTVAAEHSNQESVIDTVRALGLRGNENTSYVNCITGVKRLS